MDFSWLIQELVCNLILLLWAKTSYVIAGITVEGASLFVGGKLVTVMNNLLSGCYPVCHYLSFCLSNCSNFPAIQAVGITNIDTIPSPVITVAAAATAMGSGMSQQLQRGGDDIATTVGHGLFANRTEDSDDDYDA